IHDVKDVVIVALAFVVLQWRVIPVWALVLAGGAGGAVMGVLGLAGTIA
ncbi:chromate transporter, partial [Thalassospira xiamenensis]